jgi:hypothetical protein
MNMANKIHYESIMHCKRLIQRFKPRCDLLPGHRVATLAAVIKLSFARIYGMNKIPGNETCRATVSAFLSVNLINNSYQRIKGLTIKLSHYNTELMC